jgi:hypothetical protein
MCQVYRFPSLTFIYNKRITDEPNKRTTQATYTLTNIILHTVHHTGGAFLATVAGTMIPRLHADAASLSWHDVRKKALGVIFFEMGIMFALTLDLFL